jgi:hypothetical protein
MGVFFWVATALGKKTFSFYGTKTKPLVEKLRRCACAKSLNRQDVFERL